MNPYRSECVTASIRNVRVVIVAVAMFALAAPELFAQGQGKKPPTRAFNVVPITIQDVTLTNGQLMAHGLAGTTPFSEPLTLSLGTPSSDVSIAQACPVLNLALGPIHLNLLGLVVDTSPICLDLTAHPEGGLLGQLLCGIANLLTQGVPVSDALGQLDATQVETLTNGLTTVLDEVFEMMTSSEALQAASCNVLNLAVGPLTLNLLGLVVELDDCDDGPVTVDITAEPEGGLLGQLLCGLAGALKGGGGQTGILVLLQQIAALIGALLA